VEAGVIDEEHAPVPEDSDTKPWPRVSGPRAAAGRLLAPYSRIARRGVRAATRGLRLAELRLWLPGWVFAAVGVAPALLGVAWLVPGIGMLLAGRLLPVPMVIIFVPLAVALCYFAMRRMPARWPRFGAAEPDTPAPAPAPAAAPAAAGGRKAGMPGLAVLAMVAIAAGVGVWQGAFCPWQGVGGGGLGGGGGLAWGPGGFWVGGGFIPPCLVRGLPRVLAGGAWLGGLGGAL